MGTFNFNKAEFVKTAATEKQFIRSSMPNIVFAGKSNVGKSSVINCLLNRKNFAHVGATPGKTVNINYFLVGDKLYFVDLPGYGFAKVSAAEKLRWSELMETFFRVSEMRLGVLILDSRHVPTEDDAMMYNWFLSAGNPFVVLANKTDKLKKKELDENLRRIRAALNMDDVVPLIPFSAEKGTGRMDLINCINDVI